MILHRGIYAAALTPLRADLSCDVQALAEHCFDLMQRGCIGVALFGTTGEGASFSVNEKCEALDQLIILGLDPKKIILGNASSPISDTVELAQAVQKHGCAALLASPPSYFKNVKEEGVIAYYREVIRRTDDPQLKILLYHIPQFTGVPITLKMIEELYKEFPEQIAGLKESEGNMAFAKAVMSQFPKLAVYVGNEKLIAEAVQAGAFGSICGIANLYPELICRLFEEIGPNPEEIESIFEALKDIPFIPAAKALMESRQGERWSRALPPLVPLNTEEKTIVSKRVLSC